MRNTFVGNGIINRLCTDIAAEDDCAAQHRHHPRVIPTIAVKHRNDGQIHGRERELPADNCAHRHQIRAAMVIDHTFGTPRGARRVVERETFPLIAWHDPLERWIAACNERVVGHVAARCWIACGVIRNFDDLGTCTVHLLNRSFCDWEELSVYECRFGFAVLKYVGNGAYIQTCVDCVQNRATCGNAEMRFCLCRDVGKQRRYDVARGNANLRKGRGKLRASLMVLDIIKALFAVDHSSLFGENFGGAPQM